MPTRLFATVALVVLLGSSSGLGCASPARPSATPVPPATPRQTTAPLVKDLDAVEVRTYQGKRLDAVSSEPENSIKGPQHIDIAAYRLAVTGLVTKPLSLTYEDVTSMPAHRKVTTLHCVEGWSVTYLWQGVLLRDLFARAGYDPKAKTVIFRSVDGYSTTLPLEFVVGRNIMLAYGMNGIVMPPERGFPFQVVAEGLFGYKWAKWVSGIEVSDDTRFTGYWESQGADNTATVPGAK